MSTAKALSTRHPHLQILILDQTAFPSPHAASIDSSRVVRVDYADAAYSSLAQRALEVWRTSPHFHDSGAVLTASNDVGERSGRGYVERSYQNVSSTLGAVRVEYLADVSAIREAVGTGGGTGVGGYVNRDSGWVDAEAAIASLRSELHGRRNVRFETATVTRLAYRGSTVTGVVLACGREVTADLTVVAAGSWSPALTSPLLNGRVQITGHATAYIRLTDAERERYAAMPVVINFSSGFYAIPPSRGLVKFGQHGNGYTSATSAPSFPQKVPDDAERELRSALRELMPEFADREFETTRLCWYTDTPDGDFLVCHHPVHAGLFFATGGSGHAFKFLPVLGEEIADVLERKPDARFAEKWAWREYDASKRGGDGSRGNGRLVDLESALKGGMKSKL